MGLFGESQVAGGDRTRLGAMMKYTSYLQLLWKNTPKLQNAMLFTLHLRDLLHFREKVDVNTGNKNIHS